MHRRFLLSTFLFLLISTVEATFIAKTSFGFSNENTQDQHTMQRNFRDGAEEIIELILQSIGLKASFEIKKSNVPNAAAVVYNGKRYILYNPAFISAIKKLQPPHGLL